MQMMSHAADAEVYGRPRCSSVMRNSKAHHRHRNQAGLPGGKPRLAQLAEGIPSTPSQDLHYRGGKVLQDMSYVNLYVGGDAAWKKSDIQEIDAALAAAMTDRNLNNVMMQYFNNHPIVTRPLASHPLVGYRPGTVSQGDVEFYLAYLCKQGYLKSFDLPTTVFNFLLPQGTVLNDEPNRTGHAETAKTGNQVATKAETNPTIPKADEGDSKGGLGGYHGSVHVGNITLYYTVDVYSERKGDGTTNGIPAFADPWKNVVATLYHELNEARTDPDVEDAIRNSSNSQAAQYLGWTSDAGEEVGDYPLDEATKLSLVIKEVPVTDGSRTVPVQLQYSNAVHGPEGPIPQPHPLQ